MNTALRIRQFFFTALTLLALTAFASSCSHGEDIEAGTINGPYYDFAVIDSNDGTNVSLTAQAPGTSIDVVLKATLTEKPLDTGMFPAGTRVYISYRINTAIVQPDRNSMLIMLDTVTKARVPEIVEADAADCTLGERQMEFMMAPNRTGHYINLLVSAPSDPNRTFTCQVSRSSLDGNSPELYLSTTGVSDGTRVLYPVSIDISRFWDDKAYGGVILNAGSTNPMNATRFTFNK